MRIAFYLVPAVTLAVLLVGGVLWLSGQITNFNPFATEDVQVVGPTVIHSVRELSDLVTVELVEYTTIERGRDAGILNFARGDRVFLFAVARVGAGVDLSQISEDAVAVDRETGSVRIELPEPRVLYVALDSEATRVFDRNTGIFTKGDKDLESEARLAAEDVLREQAYRSGILERATENAKRTLTAFLAGLGFTEITVVGVGDEPADVTPSAGSAR
jgi:hypothetical protein